MNAFETDLRRAVLSPGFLLAVLLQTAALWPEGFGSTLCRLSVPVLCTLPYAGAWLDEYRSGFVKLSLTRSSWRGYIWGKYLACTLAGGGAEVLGLWLYALLKQGEVPQGGYGLAFASAAFWAGTAAVLAAASNSKYLAYGGSFVLYYFLVILCQRYWPGLYCLYPYEWLAPQHRWPFGQTGVLLMLSAGALLLGVCYGTILRRRLEHG